MRNNNRSKKPKIGATMVGGFITILLTILLIPTSLLVGLKIGILKDSSLEGIAKELNISGFAAELIPEIVHNELDSEEIDSEAILNCIPEGMMEDFSDEMISCISSGEEMETDFLKDYYTEIAQNTSQEITSFLMDELVAQAGGDAYISKSQISEIEVLKDYSETYEAELDKIIVAYGDGEGISVSDISNNDTIRNEISKQIEPVIQSTLSTTLESTIIELNKELTSDNELTEYQKYFNTATKYVTIFTILFAVLCVMLMIVTFINYRGFLDYGLRHNGVALLISGLFVVAIGLIAKFGTGQITDMVSKEFKGTGSMEQLMENVIAHGSYVIFQPIRNVGFAFLFAATLMIVLAKMIKKSKQTKSYEDYE